jgi:tRNA A37 N6-isopentenylltransferase MiaA
VQRTRALARRQWAWFRRDPRIRWVQDDEDPVEVLGAALDGV